MRVLCFALVFASLALMGQVDALGEEIENTVCMQDTDCLYRFGYMCLCMRIHRSEQGTGQCVCNVNPSVLDISCTYDAECYTMAPDSQYCVCSKVDPGQTRGECHCYNGLILG